jgi:signal transduction histidine kinase
MLKAVGVLSRMLNRDSKTAQFAQMILDPQGTIRSHGKALLTLFKSTETSLCGRNLCDIVGDGDREIVASLKQALSNQQTTWKAGVNPELSMEMLWHDGQCFATLTLKFADKQRFEGSIKEILEDPSKITQLFLRVQRAESRLDSYMRHFPGVFFNQRTDFSFQFLSQNIKSLLDVDPERFLKSGARFLSIISEQDRDFFVREIRKHSEIAEPFTMQYRMRKPKDDSIIHVTDVRSPVLSNSGILLGYEGVWLDTTRQTIAERKLTSSAWKENLAMLTAGLVHDFSNVMAGIYALSELYHDSMEPENQMYEGLGQIKKSSMEARKLVRRIIDINREETGQKNYHDPKKLICEQLDLLKIIFPRGTQIDLDFDATEVPVYLDDIEFRQVMLNLALNSKDALGSQGIVKVSTRAVSQGSSILANTHKGPYVVPRSGIIISFQDSGSGIPEAHRDRIFHSFFTTKEIHKGSGFGLYNIERIIQSAEGIIDFETQVGAGTTFHIYLPEADFTEQSFEQPVSLPPTTVTSRQRPLVVVYSLEDTSQFDLIGMLRSCNWEVIVFQDTYKLKSYLGDTRREPNLCLLIEVADTGDIPEICSLFSERSFHTQFALLPMGRGPDEIPESIAKSMNLVCDGTSNPKNVIQSLEKLVDNPLIKS